VKARSIYAVNKWEETDCQQISPEMKVTKASVEYTLSGDLDGKATVEYLMFYSKFNPVDQYKSSASYVGLIFFNGKLMGKSGSFVLEDNGTFEGGAVNSSLKIAKDSGTGELKDIVGTGSYIASQKGFHFELEYFVQ